MIEVAPHSWKNKGITTTDIKCLLCSASAAVIVYAPEGCTCSPNKIQPRCDHHLGRAYDTEESITILEDFRLY